MRRALPFLAMLACGPGVVGGGAGPTPGPGSSVAPPDPSGTRPEDWKARRFAGCSVPTDVIDLEFGVEEPLPAAFRIAGDETACQMVRFDLTRKGPVVSTFGTGQPLGDVYLLVDGRFGSCTLRGEDQVCTASLGVDTQVTVCHHAGEHGALVGRSFLVQTPTDTTVQVDPPGPEAPCSG